MADTPKQDWSLNQHGQGKDNELHNTGKLLRVQKSNADGYSVFLWLEDKRDVVATHLTADEAESIATVLSYLAQK